MTDWKPIDDNTPKDRPILAWCVHEADPYFVHGTKHLTSYGANCEGLGHALDGFNIIVWQPEEAEYCEFGELDYVIPAWWFVLYSDGETPANPILWADITEPSEEAQDMISKIVALMKVSNVPEPESPVPPL